METNKPFEIVEKEESGNFILDNGLLIPGGGNVQIVDTDLITISENYISNIQLLEYEWYSLHISNYCYWTGRGMAKCPSVIHR